MSIDHAQLYRDLGATLSRRAFRPTRAARVLGRLLADPAVARACAAARARMAGSSDAIIDACDYVERLMPTEAGSGPLYFRLSRSSLPAQAVSQPNGKFRLRSTWFELVRVAGFWNNPSGLLNGKNNQWYSVSIFGSIKVFSHK